MQLQISWQQMPLNKSLLAPGALHAAGEGVPVPGPTPAITAIALAAISNCAEMMTVVFLSKGLN